MPQKYDLGLDIGMASVGAALLADDRIVALHVRAFNKAETAKKGEPLNKIRREARSTRRRIRRRAFRLKRLRSLLADQQLIDGPDFSPSKFPNEVWQLRASGLDRKLTALEWSAVLYHILKHRGFQSTRKSEAKSDEKLGQMLGGVNQNQRRCEENGWRTVGEMAAKDDFFSQNKRNKGGEYSHTFSRGDLKQEVVALFNAQRLLGSTFADEDFEEQYIELLYARRPALSGEQLLGMLGKCTFEPSCFRAPRFSFSAERFVWLTKLNNLRISEKGTHRSLNQEERGKVISLPFELARLTYAQIRKKIGLSDSARFNGLDYWKARRNGSEMSAEKALLFEAKGFHALRKAYEVRGLNLDWERDRCNADRLDQLAYALTVFKEDVHIQEWLADKGFDQSIVDAVTSEVSFSGFIRLSLEALGKILPYMEDGQRYDESVVSAGYQHHSRPMTNIQRKLPPIKRSDFTNPVVYRALNQARKLVNAIIEHYGSPRSVHIELARDLSKSFEDRKEIERGQKEFFSKKEKAIEEFENLFGHEPRKDQLLKMRLYHEQNGKCAYSLAGIDLKRLDEDGYLQVDHILPYSRSFDDSLNNKVLVLTRENQRKGNQTPYEYLGGSQESDKWLAFKSWVEATPSLRLAKRNRLLKRDFDESDAQDFRDRHLNDTRYISKVFKNLIENNLALSDDSGSRRCVVVSGQLTAFLRTRWGLNKVRENGDLHHALDAAVVGACSHSMVKKLSDYSRKKELKTVDTGYVDPTTGELSDIEEFRRLEADFPLPWDTFRPELLAFLSPAPEKALEELGVVAAKYPSPVYPVRVSRAPQRRGAGAAHQETIRSAKNLDKGVSSLKTPLKKLKLETLSDIVGHDDPRNSALIAGLRKRLEQHGGNGSKAFKEPFYRPTKNGEQGPLVRSVKLSDTQKSGLLVRKGVANNADMVRVDVFKGGKKYFVVPVYASDLVKGELPNKAAVVRKPESDWIEMNPALGFRFVFSLYKNDWVVLEFTKKAKIEGYFGGFDRSNGTIDVWCHDRNLKVVKGGLFRGIGIKTATTLSKWHVDVLGRIYPAPHESRQLKHKG